MGVCSGLGVEVGLNSWGEELWLLYSKLLVQGRYYTFKKLKQ